MSRKSSPRSPLSIAVSIARCLVLCPALVGVVAACGSSGPSPLDGGARSDAAVRDAAALVLDAATQDAPSSRDASADHAAPELDARSPDGGTALDVLRARYCAPLARLSCTTPHDCACPDAGERPDPIDPCIEEATDTCASDLSSRVGAQLASGSVRLDGAALEACARLVEASFGRCTASPGDLEVWCASIFSEAVAVGDACTLAGSRCGDGDASCASDGTCRLLPERDAPCEAGIGCATGLVCRDGACADRGGAGAACVADAHCEDDLVCGAGVCSAALVAVGGACTERDECVAGATCLFGACRELTGGTCTGDAACPSHTTCGEVDAARCAPRLAIGEGCRESRQCEEGAYCDTTGEEGVCARRRALGETCTYDACVEGTICKSISFGTLVCSTPANEGEGCSTDASEGSDGCASGLACIRGLCAAPPTEGRGCADDGECAPGWVCRLRPDFTSECGDAAGEGELCRSYRRVSECADGLYCDPEEDACARRRTDGERCDFAGELECTSGLACAGEEGSSTCQPIPGSGDVCVRECTGELACIRQGGGGDCVAPVCGIDIVGPGDAPPTG
jgi:hypothetical protein